MLTIRRPSQRVVLGLAALTLAAGAAYLYTLYREDPDTSYVRVSGNIEVTDVELSFRMPGWVKARPVSEGEIVDEGVVVAQLDDTELAEEVALRQAELKVVDAELAALEAGSRPEEIAGAAAAVRRAEADVTRYKLEFERQKELRERNVASEQTYEAALASYDAGVAHLDEVEQRYALIQKGPRIEEIDRARARLEQAKHAIALSETRLSYATLHSPLSGVVLSENVEPGEYIVPGVPVVTVGDLLNTWVRAYVNETDLGRVKLGQPVCVATDTYPDKVYPGELTFIASQAEFTPKNVQTTEERVKLVYRAKIEIANPDMELKPGMPADASIWIGEGMPPCLP